MTTMSTAHRLSTDMLKEPFNRLDSNKLCNIRRDFISGLTSKFTNGSDTRSTEDLPNAAGFSGRKSKIRSIYGQPSISTKTKVIRPQQTDFWQSLESLDRSIDSGQSLGSGSTSFSDLRDSSNTTTPTKAINENVFASDAGTSLESSDNEPEDSPPRSVSTSSGCSTSSNDWHDDESSKTFMANFVSNIFTKSASITLEAKARFGLFARTVRGRLWFARFVSRERIEHQCTSESTFYSLTQYFAIILFECSEADDFTPAKILMNMCFTFYHIVPTTRRDFIEPGSRQYLSSVLRDQPIWRSIRFWNAAFFDAVQNERLNHFKHNGDWQDEARFQANVTFGQLGTFTHNMHSFGLPRALCLQFMQKQSTIANLSDEHIRLLRDNIESMYMNH